MEIRDEERMATIPVIVHQLGMERLMRVIRLLVVIIICLSAIIAYCIWEMNCYDYADVSLDSTGSGISNYIEAGHNGAITNGERSSKEEDKKEQSKSER